MEIIVFSDPEGTGTVTLEAPQDSVIMITGGKAQSMSGKVQSAHVTSQIIMLVSGPMGTYPIAALNPKFYLRVPPESRWMIARHNFGFDDKVLYHENNETLITDKVAQTIREILIKTDDENTLPLDLTMITQYASMSKKF